MGRDLREVTLHIDAPADKVFDFCADFWATSPVLSPGTKITEVSPGPVGVGTVFRYANDRLGLVGRTEVVQYSRPHRLVVETVANEYGPYRTVTVVEAAEDGGSTVHVFSNAKEFIPSRWMLPFAWMLAPMLRKPIARAHARFEELARATLEGPPSLRHALVSLAPPRTDNFAQSARAASDRCVVFESVAAVGRRSLKSVGGRQPIGCLVRMPSSRSEAGFSLGRGGRPRSRRRCSPRCSPRAGLIGLSGSPGQSRLRGSSAAAGVGLLRGP